MGKRVGGPEGDNPPHSCLLVFAPINAQVDNLLQRVHKESHSHEVYDDEALTDHPAPWLHLRAQRVAAPPRLGSFDQDNVQ